MHTHIILYIILSLSLTPEGVVYRQICNPMMRLFTIKCRHI